MNRIFLGILLSLCILFAGNSCSTGSDPEGVILDVFLVPAEYSLEIQNVFNDLAMDINGIAMYNLSFEEDTIKDNVSSCVEALVYRNSETSVLDSIVLNYGTSTCSSNGGSFKGKVVVDPKDENLEFFDIRLSDFYSQGFDITGAIEFQVVGSVDRNNFSMVMENGDFSITGTDDVVYTFSIATISNSYIFSENMDGKSTYIDDVFKLTTSLSGETPDGALFTLESVSDLISTYSCDNIIGGTESFTLSDVGDGEVYFGGGDPDTDCDETVIISASGAELTVEL